MTPRTLLFYALGSFAMMVATAPVGDVLSPHAFAAAAQTPNSYVVQSGDSWNSIATKFGVTLTELRAANSSSSSLAVGRRIVIPRKAVLHSDNSRWARSGTIVARTEPVVMAEAGSGSEEEAVSQGEPLATLGPPEISREYRPLGGPASRDIQTQPQTNSVAYARPSRPRSEPARREAPVEERRETPTTPRAASASTTTSNTRSLSATPASRRVRTILNPDRRVICNHPLGQAHPTWERQDVFHKVRKGENLTTIAREHRVSVAQVIAWNGLIDESDILEGDKLYMFSLSSRSPNL